MVLSVLLLFWKCGNLLHGGIVNAAFGISGECRWNRGGGTGRVRQARPTWRKKSCSWQQVVWCKFPWSAAKLPTNRRNAVEGLTKWPAERANEEQELCSFQCHQELRWVITRWYWPEWASTSAKGRTSNRQRCCRATKQPARRGLPEELESEPDLPEEQPLLQARSGRRNWS